MGKLAWGVYAVAIGVLYLVLGLHALRNPDSPLAQRWVAYCRVKGHLGPIVGVVFIFVGASLVMQQLVCGSYAQVAQLLDLRWTWWPGIWPAIAIAAAIGIWNARTAAPVLGSLTVLLTVCAGITGGQAAGFHTGVYSNRWWTIALACAVLAWILNALARRKSAP